MPSNLDRPEHPEAPPGPRARPLPAPKDGAYQFRYVRDGQSRVIALPASTPGAALLADARVKVVKGELSAADFMRWLRG